MQEQGSLEENTGNTTNSDTNCTSNYEITIELSSNHSPEFELDNTQTDNSHSHPFTLPHFGPIQKTVSLSLHRNRIFGSDRTPDGIPIPVGTPLSPVTVAVTLDLLVLELEERMCHVISQEFEFPGELTPGNIRIVHIVAPIGANTDINLFTFNIPDKLRVS